MTTQAPPLRQSRDIYGGVKRNQLNKTANPHTTTLGKFPRPTSMMLRNVPKRWNVSCSSSESGSSCTMCRTVRETSHWLQTGVGSLVNRWPCVGRVWAIRRPQPCWSCWMTPCERLSTVCSYGSPIDHKPEAIQYIGRSKQWLRSGLAD
jgi:hypothetical protein